MRGRPRRLATHNGDGQGEKMPQSDKHGGDQQPLEDVGLSQLLQVRPDVRDQAIENASPRFSTVAIVLRNEADLLRSWVVVIDRVGTRLPLEFLRHGGDTKLLLGVKGQFKPCWGRKKPLRRFRRGGVAAEKKSERSLLFQLGVGFELPYQTTAFRFYWMIQARLSK